MRQKKFYLRKEKKTREAHFIHSLATSQFKKTFSKTKTTESPTRRR
jgi:hypothetical protein